MGCQIHMAAAMVSGASANVEGQVTGTVSIAKLVYAPTGALHSRVIEVRSTVDGQARIHNGYLVSDQ